jgi:hypothetical protein
VQAVGAGQQPGDQEVGGGDLGDALRHRERDLGVVVGAVRPGCATQLQGGQSIGDQVCPVEVVGGVQVEAVAGGAELAQQVAVVVTAAGADQHSGANVGAILGQRDQQVPDNVPGVRGGSGLIEGVDHDGERAAVGMVGERLLNRVDGVLDPNRQSRGRGAGNLVRDL